MSRAQLGVDGQLFSRQRIEGETSPHLRHSLGAAGDHHQVNEGENGEHHRAHHQIARHHEISERVNDLAGIGLEEDEARGRHLQGQTEERGQEQQRREGGDLEGIGDVQGQQQQRDRESNVEGNGNVEHEGGERHDHHRHHQHHQRRQREIRITKEERPQVAAQQQREGARRWLNSANCHEAQ